jgi:hypothetical protein
MIANDPKFALKHGNRYPYDAPDAWWQDEKRQNAPSPPPPTDWAHTASRAIIGDWLDRRGLKNTLQDIDEVVRKEIVESGATIIRTALNEAVHVGVAFDNLDSEAKIAKITQYVSDGWRPVPHGWVIWMLDYIEGARG